MSNFLIKKIKDNKLYFIALLNLTIFFFIFIWISNYLNDTNFLNKLSNFHIGIIALPFLFNVLALFFYGLRFSAIIECNLKDGIFITLMGFGLNAIFPFRFGEALRITYGCKLFKFKIGEFLTAIFYEKFLDLFTLFFVVFIFGIKFFTEYFQFEYKNIYLALILIIIASFFYFIFSRKQSFLLSIVNDGFQLIRKLSNFRSILKLLILINYGKLH